MKIARLLSPLLVLLVLGAGCTETPDSTTARTTPSPVTTSAPATPKSTPVVSDNRFTPPTEAGTGSGVETPGRRRLMTATSTDGLTFTRTNTIVTDQANVPDLVMDADGTLYLYYAGWTVGDRNNAAAVAISEDQGKTWTFHQVDIGVANGRMSHSSDPDVVLLEDGTFRMYSTFNLPNSTDPGIFVEEGTDGIHFSEGTLAFSGTPPALDSNTFFAGDLWHMYTLSGRTMDSYHATSTDGLTFTEQSHKTYWIDNLDMVMSNVLPIEGGYRMYGFSPTSGDIRSLTSSDGTTWTAEAGVRLALDTTSGFESTYVKDPAVIKLLDGTYLMVYVTQIP